MSDRIVTKREILLSIAIVCIMLLLGSLIADAINDSVMEKHQEYNTALQINADKELFEYGMRTNIGNAFVYGELKAVDPVGYEEVEGQYSYIKKVKEKYTKHTRVVTKTRTVNGKTVRDRLRYDGDVFPTMKEIDEHTDENRSLGIDIGCYDAEIDRLKYPLKLVSASYTGTYEECDGRSYGDPNQGWGALYRKDADQ